MTPAGVLLGYQHAASPTRAQAPPTARALRPGLLNVRRRSPSQRLYGGVEAEAVEASPRGCRKASERRCACAGLGPRPFGELGHGGGRGSFAEAGGFRTACGTACLGAGEHRAEEAAGADAAPGPAGGPALPGDGGCGYRRFGPWRRCPFPLAGRVYQVLSVASAALLLCSCPLAVPGVRLAGRVQAGRARPPAGPRWTPGFSHCTWAALLPSLAWTSSRPRRQACQPVSVGASAFPFCSLPAVPPAAPGVVLV